MSLLANSINLLLMIALVYALLGKEDKHISPFYNMAKNARKNFFFKHLFILFC